MKHSFESLSVGSAGQERSGIHALVIDDDPEVRSAIRRILEMDGRVSVTEADSGHGGMAELAEMEFDVVLLDVHLPDSDGIDVLREILHRNPDQVVVMVTGHASYELAVRAVHEGAFDFIPKPFPSKDVLGLAVQRAVKYRRLARERQVLEAKVRNQESKDIVAHSTAMLRLMKSAAKVATTDATVLIEGESGTGKEVLARAIHQMSRRATGPFIEVDCGAISPQLMESELFGHLKGAFTGAASNSTGMIRAAHQGTLFLDEIGELPLELQTRLLRFLQEGTIRPVGSPRSDPVNVRTVAATNRNLTDLVDKGRFRNDLYFRLNVVSLRAIPLRERREEIPSLIDHFLTRNPSPDSPRLRISPPAMEVLMAYDWPGNVRELQNFLMHMVALHSDEPLRPADLPDKIRGSAIMPGSPASSSLASLPLKLEAYEMAALERAMSVAKGEIEEAARLLNVSRSTMYRKLKEHGIHP